MDDQPLPNGVVREIATSAARGIGRVAGAFVASAAICGLVGGGVAWVYLGSAFALTGLAVGAVGGVMICVLIFYLLNA